MSTPEHTEVTKEHDERFWNRLDRDGKDGCWIYPVRSKYAVVSVGAYRESAHRVAFRLINGDIPPGMCVCHRCDNPRCVNPAHLFLGTYSDNALDRDAKKRGRNSRKTHCPKGHELSGDNLYLKKARTQRNCRSCTLLQLRGYYLRNLENRRAYFRKRSKELTLANGVA